MAAWIEGQLPGKKGEWLMVCKRIVAAVAAALMFFSCGPLQASPFAELAKLSSYYGLRNGPREFSYHVPDGMLKVKLAYPNKQADMVHVTAWINNKAIYDYALPFVGTGYIIRFYRDEASGRVFMSCSSSQLAILAGYCGNSQQMETFIDSRDFDAGFAQSYPWIYVQDGELRLVLSDGYGDVPIIQQDVFVLEWDEGLQWISYAEQGVKPCHRD